MAMHDVTDYGTVGDGKTLDTAAIQKAIDACRADGGGSVLLPAGQTFVSGTLRLASNVELHVEGGATLAGSSSMADYPNPALRCLIEAEDCQNIAITGMGTIDGRARLFMKQELEHIFTCEYDRPRLIGLVGCRKVVVRDITLRDGAFWTLHPIGCDDVTISGVTILNNLKIPNNDGIDPDHCRNVRISDCHIECGDDCIVIKTTEEYARFGPSENITVTGCTMISTSAAIKLGTESCGDFRDMVFDACVIRSSNRGLSIQLRDQGNVENILFSNMVIQTRLFHDAWWGKAEPIYVTSLPRTDATRPGQIRNVRFSNILCRGEGGVFIRGCGQSRPAGIVLDRVRVEIDKTTKYEGGRIDLRPGVGGGVLDEPMAGFNIRCADDVRLHDCEVVWGEGRPAYFGKALDADDVTGLEVRNFRGDDAHEDAAGPQ